MTAREAVARALRVEFDNAGVDLDALIDGEPLGRGYIEAADAAIKALLEYWIENGPNERMLEAGAIEAGMRPSADRGPYYRSCRNVFREMLRAHLAEGR